VRGRRETILQEVLPPEERAIEAVVARYQRVAPAVTRFARSLSGRDGLNVRLGARAQSSDEEIVLDPGVFQAAYTRHAPVTAAEVALASALHEVVHLVATNFDERRPIPREWYPDDYDEELPEEPVALLDALSEAGGPAGEALFLSLEDARQEAALFHTYGGARSVLTDLYLASVPEAMERARPLGQFALACFLVVGRYIDKDRLQRRLMPNVAAALDDAAAFLEAVAESTDPWEVAGLALQLLQVARLHDLVADASNVETLGQQQAVEQADQDAIAEGVDAVRLVTPILRDVEGYDETRRSPQAMSVEDGRQADVEPEGDPGTDQIVRVSQAPTVYLPNGQGGKLLVTEMPYRFRSFADNGRAALDEAARRWGVAQRQVSGELYPLFLANQRRGLRSGYDAGDLSPYAALFLGAGLYERMFERRSLPTRRAYAVSLLVDGSASMLQPLEMVGSGRVPWAMSAATLGAWTLARLADELQIDFEVALFNRAFAANVDDSEETFVTRLHRTKGELRRTRGSAADRLTRTVNHYVIKSFDQPWRSAEDVLAGLFWMAAAPGEAATAARRDRASAPPVSMFEKAANVDEFNVSHAAERMAARHATARVLVVLADGMTRGSVEALAESVAAIEHSGTLVLGIGIGDATVEAAYGRHQIVDRPEVLAAAMIDGVRSALHRTIAALGGDTWWAHSSERALYDLPATRSNTNA